MPLKSGGNLKTAVINAALLLAAILISPGVHAQSGDGDLRHPWLDSRFRLGIGEFFQSVDSSLSVGVAGEVLKREFDFEQSFGLDNSDNRGSANFYWGFGEKWSVALQYIDQGSSHQAVLDQDVSWEDLTLKAGSFVGGGVSTEVVRAFFGRKFAEGPNYEFGAGLGLHWLRLGAFAEGEFYLNDQPYRFERRSVSAEAPLPNIGAWYAYAFSQRWLAHARLDWFSASIDEYSGGLTNAAVGIAFQPWRHFAIGLDYNYFNLNVDVDSSNWYGSADFTREGPFLYLMFDW